MSGLDHYGNLDIEAFDSLSYRHVEEWMGQERAEEDRRGQTRRCRRAPQLPGEGGVERTLPC